MFSIHTHPANILFSPQDYLTMIVDGGDGEGLIKEQIVLCPDIQILAISIARTPRLSPTDAEDLVNKWSAEFEKPSS